MISAQTLRQVNDDLRVVRASRIARQLESGLFSEEVRAACANLHAQMDARISSGEPYPSDEMFIQRGSLAIPERHLQEFISVLRGLGYTVTEVEAGIQIHW
jgi:tRNA nucleotidyltransferase/poly(A) polymerase